MILLYGPGKKAAKDRPCSLSDPIMVKDWGKFKENRNQVKKSLWADPRKRPFAVYEFHYRSMGMSVEFYAARSIRQGRLLT
jgi:hypothetical protein